MTNKVIIAGGRDFKDYNLLKEKLDLILQNLEEVEIVSGKQVTEENGEKYGADYLGEQYALSRDLPIKDFPADWDKYGKSAGPKRNKQMAEYATHLVAFDTGGRGTANMIQEATKQKLKIRIIQCNQK